jgi:MFS family permease
MADRVNERASLNSIKPMTPSLPATKNQIISAWAMWPVGLATALSLMGDATLYSVLPTHYSDAGIGLTSVGLILSINRFIRLVTNGPAGWLFDRLANGRFLFIGSLALGVFTTMLYAATSGLEWLFIARLLWGIAWSGIWIGGTAIVLQMAPGAQRGHWVGIYQMWFFFGSAIGLFLGGVLTDMVGYHNGLWISAGVSMIGLLAAVAFPVRNTNHQNPSPLVTTPWRLSMITHWRGLSSDLWGTAIAQGINRLASGGIVAATLGLILQQNIGRGLIWETWPIGVASATGGLLAARTIISLVGAPLAGTLSDRLGDRWGLLSFSLALSAIGMAVLPLPQFTALIGGIIISALAYGGVQALATALVGDLSKLQDHGKHLAIFNIAGDLGSAIGPIVAYTLLLKTGLIAVYWGCAILMLMNALWIIRFKNQFQLNK